MGWNFFAAGSIIHVMLFSNNVLVFSVVRYCTATMLPQCIMDATERVECGSYGIRKETCPGSSAAAGNQRRNHPLLGASTISVSACLVLSSGLLCLVAARSGNQGAYGNSLTIIIIMLYHSASFFSVVQRSHCSLASVAFHPFTPVWQPGSWAAWKPQLTPGPGPLVWEGMATTSVGVACSTVSGSSLQLTVSQGENSSAVTFLSFYHVADQQII